VEEIMENWYALCVKGRMERAVGRQLNDKGFETFVPLTSAANSQAANGNVVRAPLFPGYVLCRMDPLIRLQALVTPGVLHIVGDKSGPSAIPEMEIDAVRRMVDSAGVYQHWPFVEVGQKAEIVTGSLRGVKGIVTRVKDTTHIVVSVVILQRSVAVEVDARHLRILDAVAMRTDGVPVSLEGFSGSTSSAA
jgi:transcription termination/antitermination protein NusG